MPTPTNAFNAAWDLSKLQEIIRSVCIDLTEITFLVSLVSLVALIPAFSTTKGFTVRPQVQSWLRAIEQIYEHSAFDRR
jgi:hypothetical protein